jgi:hypothetical protein
MGMIMITGCAQSGTTLLYRCFCAFEGLRVPVDHELSLDQLIQCHTELPDAIHVAKRKARTVYSHGNMGKEEVAWQLGKIDQHKIKVVNIVRDPRDMVIRGGVRDRYFASMLQAARFPEYITATVRYEDLLLVPNAVQGVLADKLGLEIEHPFSAYPDFLPQHLKDQKDIPRQMRLRRIGEPK